MKSRLIHPKASVIVQVPPDRKPKIPSKKKLTSPESGYKIDAKANKLDMLDSVEITKDQTNSKLRAGMKGTILEVFNRSKTSYHVEIIKPPILATISADYVKPID